MKPILVQGGIARLPVKRPLDILGGFDSLRQLGQITAREEHEMRQQHQENAYTNNPSPESHNFSS